MKRIRISANWASPESILKRLLYQFKTEDIDLSNIEFVHDDTYDVCVFYNHVHGQVKPGVKSYIFPAEPYWSGSHSLHVGENVYVFGFDKQRYSRPDQVIESIAHTFYGGRGDWADRFDDWTYETVKTYDNVIKSKNISSVVSTYKDATSSSSLYPQRHNLIKSIINDTKFIDFFGGWHGYDNCNTIPQKLAATLDYRFCLAVENEYTKNWVTEKFYDSILTNTVPIYYGCPNIKEYYPENGYIFLESITDIDYVKDKLKYVSENAETLYNSMLPEVKKIKQRYFKEFNPLKKIIELEC